MTTLTYLFFYAFRCIGSYSGSFMVIIFTYLIS